MNNDDDRLIALIRERANNPFTRTDVEASSMSPARQSATAEMIEATEASLGYSLHPFLKRVYMEVANGGFGPGYGLLSLTTPYVGSDQRSLSAEVHEDGWPTWLLPLWNWGDATWSCMDAASADGTIVTHDDVDGPTVTDFTIRSWLEAWAKGVDMWKEMYEDRDATIINPFTKKPVHTKVRGVAKGKGWRPSF